MKQKYTLFLINILVCSSSSRIHSASPSPRDEVSIDGSATTTGAHRRNLLQPIFADDDENEEVKVIIGVKNDSGVASISQRANEYQTTKLKKIGAVSAKVKKSQLGALKADPNIEFVEPDSMYYPDGEAVLYGMEMVQAFTPTIPKILDSVPSSCSDPDSFKIGIVDSGLAVNHADVPCYNVGKSDSNCIGAEFGLSENDGEWWNPQRKFHGTHVFGTIGASGKNNEGVQGVIPDGNVCFIIARVFGESGAGSSMSDIFEAVGWMVEKGARIINMSLGGTEASEAGRKMMKTAYKAGALVIAAAGNGGGSDFHYPASHPNVISVAAVDEDEDIATFSQHNSAVDIAAPGVEILSTVPPESGGVVLLITTSVGAPGTYMKYSPQPKATLEGELVDCGDGGDVCPKGSTSQKHICLIKRGGGIKFEDKALNCEAGGGIAAVIYNNEKGLINGGLADPTAVGIPTIEITQSAGQRLASQSLGEILIVKEEIGYNYVSGTSMAAPHVSGVAAKIWRACPMCENFEVESCLFSTAIDLGQAQKDVSFGNGLVQADDAYLCLRDEMQCCSEDGTAISGNGNVTTGAPSSSRSPSASASPSAEMAPSPAPAPVLTADSTNNTLASKDMIQVMNWFENFTESFVTKGIEKSAFRRKMLNVVTEDISFQSSFVPVNQSLVPLFEDRQDFDDLIALYDYARNFTSITSTNNPEDIAPGPDDGVLYYHQAHTGSFGGGEEVSWETICKLTFNTTQGKIQRIWMTVVDSEPINRAYPTEM